MGDMRFEASREPAWLQLALRERDAVRAAGPAAVAPVRRTVGRARREFAAADMSNLTASFGGEHVSLNESLERTLPLMRARSRQLVKNDDYVKKFMRMAMNHIVGPKGFAMSCPCQRPDGTIDEADKAVVEKVFKRWAKRGVCDVTGRLSLTQLCRLLVLHWARDGEFIVRRVRDRSLNAHGYALQVIDPVLLDHTYRADFQDGRKIRMGVEVNAWGRPIAYHLRGDVESAFGIRRVRVPAAEIWHHFIQEEANQVRGVPWVHSAMRRLNDLGGFMQAAIIAARIGASNSGFFIPPSESTGDTGQLADEQQVDEQGDIELVRDAEPGRFDELPPGYDFKQFKADYPHQAVGPFIKAMLQGVASGVGADYPTLANDLEGVNFSSIRSGKLETQDEWMCLQDSLVEAFLDPMGTEWLEMGFLSGQLTPLPVSKFDKFNVIAWQGRRWPWVDPRNDAQARVLEIDNGLNSYSNVMRELGRDPDAIWRELEKDRERIDKLLRKPAAPGSSPGAATSKPPKDENDDE